MTTNYTFAVSLLYTYDNDPAGLQVWGTGTLALDVSNAPSVTGLLTVPNPLGEPVPFSGTIVQAPDAGFGSPVVFVSGKVRDVWIEATFSYNMDGFLYSGSYIGGVVDILSGNEWILYIIQGLSPQADGADAALASGKRRRRPGREEQVGTAT